MTEGSEPQGSSFLIQVQEERATHFLEVISPLSPVLPGCPSLAYSKVLLYARDPFLALQWMVLTT